MTHVNMRSIVHLFNSLPLHPGVAAVALTAVVVLPLLAAPAAAQQQSGQATAAEDPILDEIIVSVRRREERLRDVPISITAFTADDIVRGNINDLTDYFMKTPNVSYVQAGSRGEREISIRGVSNMGGDVDAVAFYVDEFNIVNGPAGSGSFNFNGSMNPQLQDIERIEILRGPQGTYFGRNATGGAVNITTKKPAPEFYAEVSAEYGEFDTWAIGGVVNVPVVADRFFVRGSAHYDESDGFVKNVNPIGGTSNSEALNIRGAARFLANDRLTIDLSVNYTEEEQGLHENIGTGVLSQSAAGLGAAVGIFTGLDETGGLYPENTTRVNRDFPEFNENEFLTLIGRIEWETDLFTITSVTGYFDSSLKFAVDLDNTSNGWLKFTNDVTSESFSTELRVASKGDGPIDWVIGGIAADDELHVQFAVVGGPDIFLGLPDDFLIDTGDRVFDTESFAVFGELDWHASDQLTLTVGGRYSDDKVSQLIQGVNFGTPDPVGWTPLELAVSLARLKSTNISSTCW